MNKWLTLGITTLFLMVTLVPGVAFADVWVNGYTKSNGTYVQGHYRSSPDGNPYNNYSFPGNTNPYTGKTATGNASTYLNNYYSTSGSSGYSYTPSYTTSASSYSSLSSYETVTGGYKSYGILFCNYGYYESGNSCKKAPANSTAYGGYSFTCDSGYQKSGDSCVAKASGVVAYEDYACDYFIAQDNTGYYALLEWYGGHIPSEGETIYGSFNGYGFKDINMGSFSAKSHVWVEDYLLSANSVVNKYNAKCQ